MKNVNLSQQSQAMLETLTNYHADRLLAFERGQARQRTAQHMDGEYNLARGLLALSHDRLRQEAPFEAACSDRIAEQVGKPPEPGHIFVPFQRDLSTTIAGAGGFLVSTEVGPGDLFVEGLLATSVMNALEVLRIPVQGDAVIPAVSTSFSAYWLGTQGTSITESSAAFSVAAATPKHLGVYFEVSRQLLLQMSRAAQVFTFGEAGKAVSAEADSKMIAGSGASGQLGGLIATAGVGSVVGTSFSWSKTCDMINSVEDNNALAQPTRSAWVLAPDVAKLLRQREKVAGNGGFILENGRIAEYRALVSKSVPAGTAIFGDWSRLAILDWSRLQVGADPFGVNSALFQKALVGIRALWSMDTVVLRPQSFCKSEGIA